MTTEKLQIPLKERGQQLVYWIITPLISTLIKCGITPNMITFAGLMLNVLASVIFIFGAEYGTRGDHRYVAWGGTVILLAGLMDMVDGRLARIGKMSSDYGALFDSVLDRYSELFMFFGICYYLVALDYLMSSIFAFFALIGSVMVSYTRARAEALGVSASVGIMQRPERILIVGVSAVLCGTLSYFIGSDFKVEAEWFPQPIFETILIFTGPIFILSVWSNITAIRRLKYAQSEMVKN